MARAESAESAAGAATVGVAGLLLETLIGERRGRASWSAVRLADGRKVMLVTPSAGHSAAELAREGRLIESLAGIAGIVRLLERVDQPPGIALAFERSRGTLAEHLRARKGDGGGRLPVTEVFRIGIAVAGALGALHERNIVHKGIRPDALLMMPGDGPNDDIVIGDFSLATELAIERQRAHLWTGQEDALPYISPEQTGRMNRDLDYRSDFYSLGVTLFELATGQLPFAADGVLEWMHCHISRPAPAACDVAPDVPRQLSDIIARLLAKNAADRYQSSFGLVTDLSRAARLLQQTGSIDRFALGRQDVSRRFQLPQTLYGREADTAVLSALFESAVAGACEICMVSGGSGIGKTVLVNELRKPLLGKRGFLIEGKFDQFRRGTPYAALADALRNLVEQIAELDPQRVSAMAAHMAEVLGANGQLVVDLVPELESLIGPQPPVPPLPQAETQNRFRIAILGFLRAATRDQPLLIFLDDLQFADASTLNLLRWIADDDRLRNLLLIGAYRSNEVDAGHPLRLALTEMERRRTVHDLALEPLSLASSVALVADTLHRTGAECSELAEHLHIVTAGNPFFLGEMLKALHAARAIRFEADRGRWQWDMGSVRGAGLQGNVVDLLVDNLRRLGDDTQQALQLAACIGNRFDLATLADIRQASAQDTLAALQPALARNLVIPLDEAYRLVTAGADAPPAMFQFPHDRVQQAAYALIDEGAKEAVHLTIGRRLRGNAGLAPTDEHLIALVGHLNAGRRLIDDPGERHALANTNLAAALIARKSSAYEQAGAFVAIGQALLPADCWDLDYPLALALATEHQLCAYLTGRNAEAEAGIDLLLARARSDIERAEFLSVRTRQYATMGRMKDSITAALAGLELLGIHISAEPDEAAVRRERAAIRRNLRGRHIADLVDAPPIADPAQAIAVRLITEIFPAAFLSASGALLPLIVMRAVNISLRHGHAQESPFAYAAFGMILCGAFDDPALGLEYGELAVAINDRSSDISLKTRVIYVYAMFIHHWSHSWAGMTAWFSRGIEWGYQSGDLLYLAYSAQDCIIWDPTLDLDTAAAQHADYLAIVRRCEYQDSLDSGTLFLQMQRCLLGETDGPTSLGGPDFDEAACVAAMSARRFMTGIANFHIYKAEVAFFHGALAEAAAHVRAQDRLVASAMALPQMVRFTITSFLVLATLVADLPKDEQPDVRERLRRDAARMGRWARNCAANFHHLHLMMLGELARLGGQSAKAIDLFDQSAVAARAAGFRRDEGLANERAGRMLFAAGRARAAEGYLRAAADIYAAWGARTKVALMAQEFAELPIAAASGAGETSIAETASALDMASVIKASQSISSELQLDRLWTSTMRVMLENAGADRGCFVLRQGGQLVIEGESAADAEARAAGRGFPASVVHHVLSINRALILNSGGEDSRFAGDPYLVEQQPRSLACIPLARQGPIEGVIYLENSLAGDVFTDDRVEIVQLLAAQVVISAENAQLYADQSRLAIAQRRFIPVQFLESLNHHDIALVAEGEHVARDMHVMFADLRDFTSVAEHLEADHVIELLNRFFAAMETQILAAGGFIDSFAGDEVRALFEGGAETPIKAGIGMWHALDALNEAAARLDQPQLKLGIGVNSGPLVLGVVGGHDRIQCTVIGDAVNLASRIEQLTKHYNVRFLIGEAAVERLPEGHGYQLRLLDLVAVKGRTLPVRIYQVVDAEREDRQRALADTARGFAEAVSAYHCGHFHDALASFTDLAARDPGDAVTSLFAERCRRYLAAPPPPGWDGAERLEHK